MPLWKMNCLSAFVVAPIHMQWMCHHVHSTCFDLLGFILVMDRKHVEFEVSMEHACRTRWKSLLSSALCIPLKFLDLNCFNSGKFIISKTVSLVTPMFCSSVLSGKWNTLPPCQHKGCEPSLLTQSETLAWKDLVCLTLSKTTRPQWSEKPMFALMWMSTTFEHSWWHNGIDCKCCIVCHCEEHQACYPTVGGTIFI